MRISFIGHSSCVPDVGKEMACFLIDGKHLVDTGWCAALTMRKYGFDPLALESITITHFHQDHYIGLPQLLFMIGLRTKKGEREPLRIYGPSKYVDRLVKTAWQFLQVERFPELEAECLVTPVQSGDKYENGEYEFEAFATRHTSGHDRPEQALGYRVRRKKDGKQFAFTGDTHHHPPIADEVKGMPLLIHDGAHTQPREAAEIAKAAEVKRLVLIHLSGTKAESALGEARAVFPATDLAREGATIEVI